ncbi:hypothetical protein BDR07DRAFT_1608845 [Suillus spraguei]|nr:hypothetical protein BDR07DRAFT_1608845 [Suillus spraguei]
MRRDVYCSSTRPSLLLSAKFVLEDDSLIDPLKSDGGRPSYLGVGTYSYRRAPFKHWQFVHVIGDSHGLFLLTSGPGRMGSAMMNKEQKPEAAAEEIRIKMQEDEIALIQFYDEELTALGPDDPAPLSI